jgi:hypothetical protein
MFVIPVGIIRINTTKKSTFKLVITLEKTWKDILCDGV